MKSVGRYEGGIFVRDNEPLHIGDHLDLYVVGSAGTVSGNGLYSLPLVGGQLDLSYARGAIDIGGVGTGGTSSITGHSQTFGVDFLEPLLVNQEWRLDGAVYFARDEATSSLAGTPLTDNFTDKPAVGGRAEEITPSRYVLATATVNYERSHGVPGLSSATVGNGTLTAIQQLPGPLAPLALDFKGGWQVSSRPQLAPAELLQLGGFGTIRGYEQAAFSGSSGYYLQSELHWPITPELDALGFFDVGASFAGPAGSLLARGAGVGATWNWRFLTLSAVGSYGFDEKRIAPHDSPYQIYFRVATHYAF